MNLVRSWRGGIACVLAASATFLAGCSPTGMATNMGIHFAENKLLPHMLADNDVDMGCAAGESFTPMIMALENIGGDPDQMGVILYTTAAYCAEQRALNEEMRYLRAERANNIDEAMDARIAQKRWNEVAARRQLESYNRLLRYYRKHFKAELGENCPRFKRDYDELVFLVGMATGMQAIINDVAAGSVVNVPKDIGAKVERGMKCLDNEKWWGVPMGTRAAIWNMFAGYAPANAKPWDEMLKATRIGDRRGVRLAHALYAISAQAKDDDVRLRDALRNFAKTKDITLDPKYQMIDKLAVIMVQNVADRYWTKNTGSRMPQGSMGKFWDDSAPKASGGDEKLLDDLME